MIFGYLFFFIIFLIIDYFYIANEINKNIEFKNSVSSNKLDYLKQQVEYSWKIVIFISIGIYFIIIKNNTFELEPKLGSFIYTIFLLISLMSFFHSKVKLDSYLTKNK